MSSPQHTILVETVVWQPDQLWELAVGHLATRFARVRELAGVPVPGPADDPLAAPVAALAAWAGEDIDWARELARYFDEHLSLHVRPDPRISRTLRAAAGAAGLVAATRLPAPVASSLLRHAGVFRVIAEVRTIPPGEGIAPDVVRELGVFTPA